MLKVEIGKTAEKFRKLVECPVCLSTPREGPVPCCPQGHLVCVSCLGKWKDGGRKDCPTCRGVMGQGKSLLAFAVAQQVQHECKHRGCTKLLYVSQIEEHERGCEWRLIVCPSAGNKCRATIPFCQVEIHAQNCRRCTWPPQLISKEEQDCICSIPKRMFGSDRDRSTPTGIWQFEKRQWWQSHR